MRPWPTRAVAPWPKISVSKGFLNKDGTINFTCILYHVPVSCTAWVLVRSLLRLYLMGKTGLYIYRIYKNKNIIRVMILTYGPAKGLIGWNPLISFKD
jgi:hypothetical protein